MQKVIDFRLRPPLLSFLNTRIWSPDALRSYAALQGIEPAESAMRRSIEMLLKEMDESGIVLGVLNGRQTPAYGEVTNEDAATIVDQYPDRFVGLVGVNPFRGAANLAETEQFLGEKQFKGISIDLGMYEEPLFADDRRLFAYYELCVRFDCPAVLTVGPGAFPDLSYSNPIPIDRLAGQFPTLKIVIAHGCWPYADLVCGVAARRHNVYLMPDMYYVGFPGEDSFTAAITTFAGDRFLFGTAYPCRPLRMTVEQYGTLGLSASLLEKVLYKNAADLLKLEGGLRA